MELNLWTNDTDYVIAETAEEALNIMAKLYGFQIPLNKEQKDEIGYEEDWTTMNKDFKFTYIHENGKRETKKVSEWIKEEGKGYFACSDY